MQRTLILLALLLAGCSSAPPAPTPRVPVDIPAPPVPRPGTLAFAADWTRPLHAELRCGGPGLLSPFACDLRPDAIWGVLPQEGGGGIDCALPTPNVCFQPENGLLHFHSGHVGMALISARTFDGSRPISAEAVVNVTNDCGDVSFMGPVLYGGGSDDGDPTGTYAAAYISCAGPSDPPKLWLYRPPYAGPVNSELVTPGEHAIRIDYAPGVGFTLLLDGQIKLPPTPLSGAPNTFPHDPHVALWFGRVDGYVGRFDVMVGP